MALTVSCLRPLGLLPRTLRGSSLALSCLVQQRYDLQVKEDTIALTNVGFSVHVDVLRELNLASSSQPTDSNKILAYWLSKRRQADGLKWSPKCPSEIVLAFGLIAESEAAQAASNTTFVLALEGGLEQGVTKILEIEVDRQKIVFPRMSPAIW